LAGACVARPEDIAHAAVPDTRNDFVVARAGQHAAPGHFAPNLGDVFGGEEVAFDENLMQGLRAPRPAMMRQASRVSWT